MLTPAVARGIVLAVLILYFAGGMISRSIKADQENVYLFSSWSLYSRVPQLNQTEYVLLVHRIAAESYHPPLHGLKARGAVYSTLVDYYHVLAHDVSALARALEDGNPSQIDTARKAVEKNFLSHPISYQIARLRFNPLEYWKHGTIASTEILGSFTSAAYE